MLSTYAAPRLCRSLVLACVLGLSTALFAQSSALPELTLAAALLAAESRSQALPAQEAAASAARQSAHAAGQLPDPVLNLSLGSVPIEGPMRYSLDRDFMTIRVVGFSQNLTRAEKRQARAAVLEREADVAIATRGARLTALRRNTARAWFERYFQQAQLALIKAQSDEASAQVQAAEAAYGSGRASQADLIAARSMLARIHERQIDVAGRMSNAQTALLRWVGEAGQQPLAALPDIRHSRHAANALANSIAQHPDVQMLNAREGVAHAGAQLAQQNKRADWSVSLSYAYRSAPFANMVSLGVSIPLQWNQANRQDRDLAASEAKLAQVRAEREELMREHSLQTQQWHTSWRSNVQRLDDYDKSLIPLAAERTRAIEAAFAGGKTSLAAVFEARRMEVDTHIERLRIEMETAALWIELEYLVAEPANSAPALAAQQGVAP